MNPCDFLDLETIRANTKRSTVEQKTISEILDSINSMKFLDLRDRSMFEMMYGIGLRVGEIVKLAVTDVDMREGKIFIRQAKGRKDRIVPIGKNALSLLKKYIEYGRNYLEKITDREILFLSGKGKRITVNDVAKALKKRAKTLYPDLRIYPHMLRHSFATHMLEAGAGIKHIKDILGHNSIETTVIYTHFNSQSLKKILKMFHPRENELYEEFPTEKYIRFER
mgnify:CR=1 FL=1